MKIRQKAIDLDNIAKEAYVSRLLMDWDRGKALSEIRDKKMFIDLGFFTFGEYLDDRNIYRLNAYLVIALYENFTDDELIRLARNKGYPEIINLLFEKGKKNGQPRKRSKSKGT